MLSTYFFKKTIEIIRNDERNHANDDFYARKLRKASFRTMKGCLLEHDMYAFTT
jgi:hypothetical protein